MKKLWMEESALRVYNNGQQSTIKMTPTEKSNEQKH